MSTTDLTALGFTHLWTDTQGRRRHVHPDDPQQEELAEADGAPPDQRTLRRILTRTNRRASELRTLEHLMRQPPQGGNHNRGTGQARHQAGGRR